MSKIVTYEDLVKLHSFEERFRKLVINGEPVGSATFGFNRHLNQAFYKSDLWLETRDTIIIRDGGCDLGVPGVPINGNFYVHHIDPITIDDLIHKTKKLTDPNNLILCSLLTHNGIHYGNYDIIRQKTIIERTSGDTCPWKRR